MAVRPQDAAEARLACAGKVSLFEVALDDSWARDIGPTFLVGPEGRRAGTVWHFNAWGNKYHPYTNDAEVAERILNAAGLPVYRAPLVCEGGAIHVDGEGTLLTTEQCLLNPNRNPHMSRQQIEERLALFTGARRIVWLGEGFSDEETDGHVDNIACFAGPGRRARFARRFRL
jgi:agmatine deiminase